MRLSTKVDIYGVSVVTCSGRRQNSPTQNDSQIVKYKNIFSTGQKVKKNYSAPKEILSVCKQPPCISGVGLMLFQLVVPKSLEYRRCSSHS